MKHGELARYLVRAALDRDFRAMALADPDASFAGFALTDTERELLRRRDATVLGWLGNPPAGEAEPPPFPPTGRASGSQPAGPPGGQLPPVELLLRLGAIPQVTAGGTLQLGHFATLHAAPAPGECLPPVADLPAGAVGPVHFRITLTPCAAAQPDGSVAVSYRSRIAPLDAPAEAASVGDSPWNHQLDTAAARGAAAAVLAAPPAERYQRLLDLIAIVTAHGEPA